MKQTVRMHVVFEVPVPRCLTVAVFHFSSEDHFVETRNLAKESVRVTVV